MGGWEPAPKLSPQTGWVHPISKQDQYPPPGLLKGGMNTGSMGTQQMAKGFNLSQAISPLF